MSEIQSHTTAYRLRRAGAILAGVAVFSLGNAGITYENYHTDVTRNKEAQQHGDPYFKGYMRATLDAEKNHAVREGGIGSLLAATALIAVGASGRKPR